MRWLLLPLLFGLTACLHTTNYADQSAKRHVSELNAYSLSGSGYQIILQDSYPIDRLSPIYISATNELLSVKLSTALNRHYTVQPLSASLRIDALAIDSLSQLPAAGFLFRIEPLLSCKKQHLSCEPHSLYEQLAISHHKDRYMPRRHRYKILVIDLYSDKTIEVVTITTRRSLLSRHQLSASLLDEALARLSEQLAASN